jgi:hypothetical protein
MDSVIYMPLLGEGTDCWRSVRSVQVAEGVFEVVDQLREGESWAFAPGSRVRCRNHAFTTGEQGLVAFEYAVASNQYYQLLKKHEREMFRVVLADGKEAVIRVLHVDEQYEDFTYDLVSTNIEGTVDRPASGVAYVSKFVDLVSARLEE